MVSCPLLTPQTFLLALTHRRCAAKRGLRGLGSVRRADFETLSGPEFPLRYPPRITVRGQTVQGGSVLLRKAPLRSRVMPWSTKRPCGPLAFRRATEGSRVLRKVRGVKRGQATIRCPVPFCPCRWAPTPLRRRAAASPGRRRRPLCTLTSSVKSPPPAAPLYRRNHSPSAEGEKNRLLPAVKIMKYLSFFWTNTS